MNEHSLLFRYAESTADNIELILDYLNSQPGRAPVTKHDAIRYAIAMTALHIANEREGELTD